MKILRIATATTATLPPVSCLDGQPIMHLHYLLNYDVKRICPQNNFYIVTYSFVSENMWLSSQKTLYEIIIHMCVFIFYFFIYYCCLFLFIFSFIYYLFTHLLSSLLFFCFIFIQDDARKLCWWKSASLPTGRGVVLHGANAALWLNVSGSLAFLLFR